MVFQVNNIVRDVRICLEENAAISTDDLELAEIEDSETLTLNQIIKSKIVEGVRRVHEKAPTHLIENAVPITTGDTVLDGDAKTFGSSIHWEDETSGYVMLPDDFMRLIMFKMSDWERTAYNAISVYDAKYDQQSSRYKGLRGTPEKPLCVIAFRPEGKVLEFYSTNDKTAKVVMATYLPFPVIDSNDGIRISKRCYEAAMYIIAGLTAITYGDKEKASELIELSNSLLGISAQQQQ